MTKRRAAGRRGAVPRQPGRAFADDVAPTGRRSAASTSTSRARLEPAELHTTEIRGDLLERLYLWLTRVYGRDERFTVATYVAGVRAFLRFCARRHLLAPDVSFEELRDNVREVMGRVPYRTPRIDQRLVLIVTHVDGLALPAGDQYGGQPRQELLRDRALLRTLFTTGMRREEVANLTRADVQDGHARQALITGQGEQGAPRVLRRPGACRDQGVPGGSRRPAPAAVLAPRPRTRTAGPDRAAALAAVAKGRLGRRQAVRGGRRGRGDHPRFPPRQGERDVESWRQALEVQDILGHASPETTKKIYAHYEVSHLRDVFDRYSATAEELAEALDDAEASGLSTVRAAGRMRSAPENRTVESLPGIASGKSAVQSQRSFPGITNIVITTIVALLAFGMAFVSGYLFGRSDRPTGRSRFWTSSSRRRPARPTTACSATEEQQRFKVFWETWQIVERDFYDKTQIDHQKLIYGAIKGMVDAVGDPYTVYQTPAQREVSDTDLRGSFDGIGIQVDMKDNRLTVVAPIEGSPAEAAGPPGDIVLEVDGKSLPARR